MNKILIISLFCIQNLSRGHIIEILEILYSYVMFLIILSYLYIISLIIYGSYKIMSPFIVR